MTFYWTQGTKGLTVFYVLVKNLYQERLKNQTFQKNIFIVRTRLKNIWKAIVWNLHFKTTFSILNKPLFFMFGKIFISFATIITLFSFFFSGKILITFTRLVFVVFEPLFIFFVLSVFICMRKKNYIYYFFYISDLAKSLHYALLSHLFKKAVYYFFI